MPVEGISYGKGVGRVVGSEREIGDITRRLRRLRALSVVAECCAPVFPAHHPSKTAP